MSDVTAVLVKELRAFTGEGMVACKKALVECDGNLVIAAGWLATEGQLVVRHNDTPTKRYARAVAHGMSCYQMYNGKLVSKV